MALSEIFSPEASVAIWQREVNTTISQYFEAVFQELGLGVRGVFSMETLKDALNNTLPEHAGKQAAIDDIHLVSDMLTCLFHCDSVGLRLAPLSSAMCPSFHVDNIPVRLVNTYLGPGTEWLPHEALHDDQNRAENSSSTQDWCKTKSGLFYQKSQIQQLNAFDAALLKGKAWEDHEEMAVIHRSCQVQENEKRVLLTLDPM